MKRWQGWGSSPRTWASLALSLAILLMGTNFELLWDSFLTPFKPSRMAFVIGGSLLASAWLRRWFNAQVEDNKRKRRFLLPFVLGFAVLPISGIGAHEIYTGPAQVGGGIAEAGEIIVGFLGAIASAAFGVVFCSWTLVLVRYVRLAEQSKAHDGGQLVQASIWGGLFATSSLMLTLCGMLLGLAERLPDMIGQIAIWGVWCLTWLSSLTWLIRIATNRRAKRRWLRLVKAEEIHGYDIKSLVEHPEWAALPPYFTAQSYSGVLVWEPDDESGVLEALGRVE